MTTLFLHGWNSVPGGVKPTYLKDHGHEVVKPKLPDDDFTEAVRIAQAEFDKHQPQVIVGSSRGGAVAMKTLARSLWLAMIAGPEMEEETWKVFREQGGMDDDAIEPIKEVYFDKMKPAVSDDELVLLRQRYQLKRKE